MFVGATRRRRRNRAADADRAEDPRDRARRLHGRGDGCPRRARGAEDHPPAVPAVDAGDTRSRPSQRSPSRSTWRPDRGPTCGGCAIGASGRPARARGRRGQGSDGTNEALSEAPHRPAARAAPPRRSPSSRSVPERPALRGRRGRRRRGLGSGAGPPPAAPRPPAGRRRPSSRPRCRRSARRRRSRSRRLRDPGEHAAHPASPTVPPAPSTSTSGRLHRQMSRAAAGHTTVRDNVRSSWRPTPPRVSDRRPRPGAARGDGPLAARPRRAQRRVSAPMLSQVERGETSPTLQVAARIAARPRAAAVPAAAPRRGRRGHDRARRRAPRAAARAPRPPLRGAHARRCPASAPSSRATCSPPGARDRRPRRPADARARQPRDGARRGRPRRAALRRRRHELDEGDCVTFDADLPHHFENPGPEEATLLAVVSAGLRRS